MVSGRMVRAAGILSVSTLISRILGLIREILFAGIFGANYVTDAFRVAYAIPYVLRRLLGEGAMSAYLVPVFTDIRAKEGDENAKIFAYTAYTTFSLVVFAIIAIGIAIAPLIVFIIAPGLKSNPEAFNLAVYLARLMLPYMFLMMTSAMSMGILNSYEHFFTPSLSPIVMNLAFIGAMLYLCPLLGGDISNQIVGLAYGVLIGGLLQVLVQVPAQFRFGIKFKPIFNFMHKGIKRMLLLMGPAMLVIGVVRINLLLDNIAASFLGEGVISILNYGERLLQFPLGIIGFAISTSSLPLLSRYFSDGKLDQMKRTLMEAFTLATVVCLPAMFGLFALGGPLVEVIFRHGAFTMGDAHATTSVLYAFSIGLFGFVGVQVLVPGFYAMHDTKTPVWGALSALVTNGTLNFALMPFFGAFGIALATSISAYVNALVIAMLLRRRIGRLGFREFTKKALRIALASIVMAVLVWLAYHWLITIIGYGLIEKIIGVVVCTGLGVALFLAFSKLLGITEVNDIISRLFRRSPD